MLDQWSTEVQIYDSVSVYGELANTTQTGTISSLAYKSLKPLVNPKLSEDMYGQCIRSCTGPFSDNLKRSVRKDIISIFGVRDCPDNLQLCVNRQLAFDLSSPRRVKLWAGPTNNYDTSTLQFHEMYTNSDKWKKHNLGMYDTIITYDELVAVCPIIQDVVDICLPLLKDWVFDEDKEWVQVQIAGYAEGAGIDPHNDFPLGFRKSMALIPLDDGMLQWGGKSGGGRPVKSLAMPYKKGDVVVVEKGGVGDDLFKHNLYRADFDVLNRLGSARMGQIWFASNPPLTYAPKNT